MRFQFLVFHDEVCRIRWHALRVSRNRILAQCFVGDRDIAMEMICSGNAIDWPKFSGGYYSSCSGDDVDMKRLRETIAPVD